MNVEFGYGVIAFAIAYLVVGMDLVTSKYPETFFAVRRSGAFWAYCAVYGVLAGFVALSFNQLDIELKGLGMDNPLVRALAVGVSTKALLGITVFNVSVGTQSFPLGTRSLVMLFEPLLLRKIALAEFNAVETYIEKNGRRWNDLAAVKERITEHLPEMPKAEKAGFLTDLGEAATVSDALKLYLRSFGPKTFARVFLGLA